MIKHTDLDGRKYKVVLDTGGRVLRVSVEIETIHPGDYRTRFWMRIRGDRDGFPGPRAREVLAQLALRYPGPNPEAVAGEISTGYLRAMADR